MAVWARLELAKLRVKAVYGYQFHHQTMLRYLWRESNSQFKLILNQLCLPIAPHRHGCPEMIQTSVLRFRAVCSIVKLQDNFKYSQRESNPYFYLERVTTWPLVYESKSFKLGLGFNTAGKFVTGKQIHKSIPFLNSLSVNSNSKSIIKYFSNLNLLFFF